MRPPLLAALAALALAGCTHTATVPVNLVSRADFPPSERDAVWSRAVLSLHRVGTLARVDEAGLVATTEPMSGVMQCGRARCPVTATLQVIVAPAGQFSARYNRLVSGEADTSYDGRYEKILADEEIAALQVELDRWVAEVTAGAPPAPAH
jgi:hypothetical protein